MKHKIKRLLSLLLSLTMLTAALPTSIWAEETGFSQATGAEAELPNEPGRRVDDARRLNYRKQQTSRSFQASRRNCRRKPKYRRAR